MFHARFITLRLGPFLCKVVAPLQFSCSSRLRNFYLTVELVRVFRDVRRQPHAVVCDILTMSKIQEEHIDLPEESMGHSSSTEGLSSLRFTKHEDAVLTRKLDRHILPM